MKTPSDFLKSIKGQPVIVKLNSGVDYRGAAPPSSVRARNAAAAPSPVLSPCAASLLRPATSSRCNKDSCLSSVIALYWGQQMHPSAVLHTFYFSLYCVSPD